MPGREPTAPRAQLRGRYLARNPLLHAALGTSDLAVRTARRVGLVTPESPPDSAPRRLLVAIGGHMGDAVLGTGAIAAARRWFPDAEIGVVAASWNVPVLEGHPDVARIHVLNHWHSNRTVSGLTRRWAQHVGTFRTASREIAAVGYDAAVDTYPYFENAAVLLARAGVPWRVGYESGGLGTLYSHALAWHPAHVAVLHRGAIAALAEDAGVRNSAIANPSPDYELPPVRAEVAAAVAGWLEAHGIHPGYVVVHVGAGDPGKAWPAARWRRVVQALRAAGHQVVLTGAGEREKVVAADASRGIHGCADTVGQFTWSEFVAVIAAGAACIAPDTAAGHVAAATGTPVVVTWNGGNDPAQWSPAGSTVIMSGPEGNEGGAMNDDADHAIDAVMRAVTCAMERSR